MRTRNVVSILAFCAALAGTGCGSGSKDSQAPAASEAAKAPAKNIKVPLLVVQGANDPRVLQVESDGIIAAVRATNVPVEYVLFPDEGHGFTKRESRIKASSSYVAFLDEHLKGEKEGGAE